MPQTKAKKKFFPTEADKIFPNISFAIGKNLTIARFQKYKVTLKNVVGGEE